MLEAVTNGEIASANLMSDDVNINARFGYVVYKVRSSIQFFSYLTNISRN